LLQLRLWSGKALHARHDLARETDGAFVLFVRGAARVEELEDLEVRRVHGCAVGIAEDGDEFVAEDAHVGVHEWRGRHGGVGDCKRVKKETTR